MITTTEEKIKKLSNILQHEEFVLKTRSTYEALYSAASKGLSMTVETGSEIIAFAALWPTPDSSWYELGTVWVHPNYRKSGIGTALILGVLNTLPRGTHSFLLSQSSVLSYIAQKHGWRVVADWQNNAFWRKITEEDVVVAGGSETNLVNTGLMNGAKINKRQVAGQGAELFILT